jgi:hypothetical protein
MSILDNIKGHRSGDDGDLSGGKFNPFRLLSIGEIMVRYTDGIRIKDFVFLAVLTSERLILIDSARQGTGQITKEIPFSVIKQADLERDEKDRPTLVISMEVGDQSRVMRLVFTGLISEPDSECREWYTAINGYPPERYVQPEIRLDEPADKEKVIIVSEHVVPAPVSEPVVSPPPAPVIPVDSIREPVPPIPAQAPIAAPPSTPSPSPVPSPPVPSVPVAPPVSSLPQKSPKKHPGRTEATRQYKSSAPVQQARVPPVRQVPMTPVPDGSVRIVMEKPDITAFRVPGEPAGTGALKSSASGKFCIQCGAKIPAESRFCQVCAARQT